MITNKNRGTFGILYGIRLPRGLSYFRPVISAISFMRFKLFKNTFYEFVQTVFVNVRSVVAVSGICFIAA